MKIINFLLPLIPTLLLHLILIRKRKFLGAYGKQAVLWTVDLVTSLALTGMTLYYFDYTFSFVGFLKCFWPVAVSILLAILLFLVGPSGFALFGRRKNREITEYEEWNFNQVACAIRNCCYGLLIGAILLGIAVMKLKLNVEVFYIVQGIFGISAIVLPALSLRQTWFWIRTAAVWKE